MLYNALIPAGFQPYVEEWWHYNIDNQMAAMTIKYATGTPGEVRFGNASLSEEQQRHEHLHQMLFGLLREHADQPQLELVIPPELADAGLTRESFMKLFDTTRGDPRETHEQQRSNDMKYRGDLTGITAKVREATANTGN